MKKLVLETTAPFQGLPELVAYKEGLFAKEGLTIEWIERESADKTHRRRREQPEGPRSVLEPRPDARAGQGRHVQRLRMGQLLPRPGHQGRQPPGRAARHRHLCRDRGAARIRRCSPASSSPDKNVGVPFYFGTHYLALHLLEGFMPRDQIRLVRTPNGSRQRFDAMMKGEVEATTLTEPYVTLAEKNGCRLICCGVLSRHRGRLRPGRRRDLRRVQPRGARGGAADQREQGARICATSSTITARTRRSRRSRPQDLRAEPHRGGRSGADPARRDAAHLRVAEELGHAGADRDAARAGQSPGAAGRPLGRGGVV